jgi:uncharacterized protein (TIGR02996 family)
MPSRDDFLKSICDHPEDDGPRLVYADWLDEHGEPGRAELIRVQCELAGLAPDAPNYIDLEERQKELSACMRWAPTEGLPPVQGVSWDTTLERGFPAAVIYHHNAVRVRHRNLETLVSCLEHVAVRTPVRHAKCYFLTPELSAGLLGSPVLEKYSGLTLGTQGGEAEANEDARRLAASWHVRNLRCLHRFSYLGDEGLAALARSPFLRRLTWLATGTFSATAAGLAALGRASWLAGLRRLDLSHGEECLSGLAGWSPLPHLHTLVVDDVHLGPASRAALVRSRTFPRLARLSLSSCDLGMVGIKALGRQDWPLTELRLDSAGLGTRGATALAGSRRMASLRSLDLADNAIEPRGVVALAGSPRLSRLRHLDLGKNQLGAGGLETLTASPHLKGLTSLNLRYPVTHHYPITPADVRAFLSSLEMPGLRHLNLCGMSIGARGAKALASNPHFARLTMLTLRDCKIPDNGIRELLDSPHLQGLVSLDVAANPLGPGLKPLADPKVLPRLGDCQFDVNRQANRPFWNRVQRRLRMIWLRMT